MADQASGMHLVNLTIRNTVRGQAEGLLITGERNIVSHAAIYGSGDALQVNGSAYLTDSLIAGDGDTILGRGAAFFTNCEIQSRGPFTWTRNTAANRGNVFLNCRFKTNGPEPTVIARAPANGGRTYPNVEVVLLNCALEGISPVGWGDVGGDTSQAHYWEYNSTSLRDGSPVDMSARHPVSRRLKKDEDSETIANYSNPAWVLGGWSPAMAPVILSQPASITASPGRTAELTVTAAAIPDAAYQWIKDGAPMAGATGKALGFAAVRASDAGAYTVTVTNASGTTTSRAATLTVR
jgi:pectinesterase